MTKICATCNKEITASDYMATDETSKKTYHLTCWDRQRPNALIERDKRRAHDAVIEQAKARLTTEQKQEMRERAETFENEFNPSHVLALLDEVANVRRTTIEDAATACHAFIERIKARGIFYNHDTLPYHECEMAIRALLET